MNAEWNVNVIADMSEEHNLRNLCRQFEQKYVDWHRPATYRGYRISREWPAIGECGRYTRDGVRVRFVTTHSRSIQIHTPDGQVIGEFKMQPGLAKNLYVTAGSLVDDPADHCSPDGSPCHCERCNARAS